VDGGQIVQQIMSVHFAVQNDSRTWLRNEGNGVALFDMPDVCPNADISPQRHIVYLVDAEALKIREQPFIFRDVCLDCWSSHEGYGNARRKVFKKASSIVFEVSRPMFTRGNAPTATDTLGGIGFHLDVSGSILMGYVRHFHRTLADAPVATYA
jgi:hypothetical protein